MAATTDRERFNWWQNAALDAWEKAERTGIVEAVTGSGKTHVAYKAIKRLWNAPGGKLLYPLIVVPTRPLMKQWKRGLEKELGPDAVVGFHGDGHHDTFGSSVGGKLVNIVVSTMHSAGPAINQKGLFDHLKHPGAGKSLLIADECHHVTSATAKLYPKVLEYPFDYRLGLTATLSDFAIDGLGKVVYEYNLKTAVAQGVIPSFDIVNVGVSLTNDERDRYLKLSAQIGEALKEVCTNHELDMDDGEWLWIELQRLAREDDCLDVRRLFGLVFKKAELVYMAQNKTSLAPAVIRQLVGEGRKILVFFERIASAEMAAEDTPYKLAKETRDAVNSGGGNIECLIYHSQMKHQERDAVLEKFGKAGPCALFACRALNEGLDVPTVDGAVIVASTQNRREMIQRIGRTLRQDEGKRRPVVIILHAKGTNDDYVRINPNDGYFSGPARIFQTDGPHCLEVLASLEQEAPAGGGEAEAWTCLGDLDKDHHVDLPQILDDLKLGTTIRAEFAKGPAVEGPLTTVDRAMKRFRIGVTKYWMTDLKRIYTKPGAG